MSKAGNAYLRTALYRMAVVGIQHNPVIGAHYARKRAQGKSKMNAIGHCMKKALAIVWASGAAARTSPPRRRRLDKPLWDLGLVANRLGFPLRRDEGLAW